ncbi:MAG: hypothetical protein JKY51_01420 [Opitutaceae bacterium]|nr:hypothetical protein [Opitutaceae bacterium]
MRPNRLQPSLIIALLLSFFIEDTAQATAKTEDLTIGKTWCATSTALTDGGRIDAIDYLGDGVVIAGTRNPIPRIIYKSEDYGNTWKTIGPVTDRGFITCIAGYKGGIAYLLEGYNTHVWKTEDYGETWKDLGRVAESKNTEGYANAYSLIVTTNGTVLVATAQSAGGHIIRSTDGGNTWTDIGSISERALYRLTRINGGILANGWAGTIYLSTDDGQTWETERHLSETDLYATEYLGDGIILQGDKAGRLFRSHDNGLTWEHLGIIGDATDDLVNLGNGNVVLTTYTKEKNIYHSSDYGKTWINLGPPATENDDWFDHVISFEHQGEFIAVGGTNKGYLMTTCPDPETKLTH